MDNKPICVVDSRSALAIAIKFGSEAVGANYQSHSQFSFGSDCAEGQSGDELPHSKKSPRSAGSHLGSYSAPVEGRRGEFAKERLVGFGELAEVEKTPAAGFC